MVYNFTLSNGFEIAEQLERDGARLHKTAAKNVSHSLAKELISPHEELQSLSHDTDLYHK
jgi:hypothetical protein